MLAIEKALFLSLCSGLSAGYQWRRRLAAPVSDDRMPPTVLLDGRQLAELAALYRQGDAEALEIVRSLQARADAILEQPVVRVTDKGPVAGGESPNGEFPNDYRSLAKYWWPDPASDDGAPYVRRDGEVNPACYADHFDASRMVFLAESLQVLSLATWFTGDAAYRERAVAQLEAWFVTPESRQSAHFQFAQIIPGRSALQPSGLIEARHLIYVTESILLLEGADALPASLSAALREWFRELLAWFRTSDKGLAAGKASNNVALWYDLQCLAYAWFVGDDTLVQYIATEVAVTRREDQVDLDGSLPAELDRANPMDYVAFTLAAMSQLSRYGDATGVPIWSQTDGDGRSFQRAHEWFIQQAEVKESHEASQGLLGEARSSDQQDQVVSRLGETGDLVLQLAMVNRLADARRRMLEVRDRQTKRKTVRIAELERELASSEKKLKTLTQKQGKEAEQIMEENKQASARLERLEKELVKAREARIKELQDVIHRQEEQARDGERQRELQQQVKDQKEKLAQLETRFRDAKRQFDTRLAEAETAKSTFSTENDRLERELKQQQGDYQKLKLAQDADRQQFKEKEKRFGELLKSNEKELEKLLKAFRERPKASAVDDAKQREEIKKLKQELRGQQRKVARLQETADRQKLRADYFKERSDKILKSRSWRMTAVLRKLTGGDSGKKR
ncbi:alginate lyase family protein [Salinicola halophyticus]|uniref:alginate lyase family protein n=1 Tax=Salinicola halophyticus TaxID=1808881 RepID=UPI003F483705